MAAFNPKDWRDWPDTSTPRDAAALEDQETRLAAYTDTTAAALTATGLASARPAANAVPAGSIYVASDTGEVSRSNGSAWTSLGTVNPDLGITRSERPIYFDFADTTTFARGWTTVVGTVPTVSGGKASPANASETVITRAAESIGDCEIVSEVVTPGALTAGNSWSWLIGYLDNSNYLMGRIASASTSSFSIEIYSKIAGAFTLLASSAITTPSVSTSYWVRLTKIGDRFDTEWWTTNPAAGGSPATSISSTLTSTAKTLFGAGTRGAFGFRHAGGGSQSISTLIIRPLGRPPRQRDVQVFTSSGTWTKPAGAAADPRAVTRFLMVGAGSGGGSGARRAAGTATSGGAGGGGGAVTDAQCPTSLLKSSFTMNIPAGGLGGAAVTANDTNGNNGGGGGVTWCTPFANDTSRELVARNGSGGGGGSTGASGGGGSSQGVFAGSSGASGTAGAAGSDGPYLTGVGAAGGGSGGGVTAAPAATAGGKGGVQAMGNTASAPAGGTAPGGAGTSGSAVAGGAWLYGDLYRAGCGGGGGASSTSGAGGNGATGESFGGGGGGGGSSLNGNNSGAGGAGGPGIGVVVTEWGG